MGPNTLTGKKPPCGIPVPGAHEVCFISSCQQKWSQWIMQESKWKTLPMKKAALVWGWGSNWPCLWLSRAPELALVCWAVRLLLNTVDCALGAKCTGLDRLLNHQRKVRELPTHLKPSALQTTPAGQDYVASGFYRWAGLLAFGIVCFLLPSYFLFLSLA